MAMRAGESSGEVFRRDFDRRLMVRFRGPVMTSDAGLLAYRKLDALGATVMACETLTGTAPAGMAAMRWSACCGGECSGGSHGHRLWRAPAPAPWQRAALVEDRSLRESQLNINWSSGRYRITCPLTGYRKVIDQFELSVPL
jgi:hypothetical protein